MPPPHWLRIYTEGHPTAFIGRITLNKYQTHLYLSLQKMVYSIIYRNKLASLGYASPKLRLTDSLTYLLTGVKCRATSVAKNVLSKRKVFTVEFITFNDLARKNIFAYQPLCYLSVILSESIIFIEDYCNCRVAHHLFEWAQTMKIC